MFIKGDTYSFSFTSTCNHYYIVLIIYKLGRFPEFVTFSVFVVKYYQGEIFSKFAILEFQNWGHFVEALHTFEIYAVTFCLYFAGKLFSVGAVLGGNSVTLFGMCLSTSKPLFLIKSLFYFLEGIFTKNFWRTLYSGDPWRGDPCYSAAIAILYWLKMVLVIVLETILVFCKKVIF